MKNIKNLLLVDIGNSNIHFSIDQTYKSVPIEAFKAPLIPVHTKAYIACVAHFDLIECFTHPKIVKAHVYKNLTFDYDLAQLGVDRFLAIVAAYEKFPQQNLMIIDIGTFVTVDIIAANRHISGGIVPGLVLLKNSHDFKGRDSENAWQTGIEEMLIAYIEKHCKAFKGKILVTGGGQNLAKIDFATYHQNLVIEGLKILYG